MKVRNLKANHNKIEHLSNGFPAVLASMKVRNLKANHNGLNASTPNPSAVLASMKVRNLKANHNRRKDDEIERLSCISKYEGTESES